MYEILLNNEACVSVQADSKNSLFFFFWLERGVGTGQYASFCWLYMCTQIVSLLDSIRIYKSNLQRYFPEENAKQCMLILCMGTINSR